jgi:pyruvate dehydrogenase complex dehydrogenase (E1) component
VLFVASGRKLSEAREAARRLLDEDGIGSRILNVTSYEALWRDWDAFANDPSAWEDPERTYTLHDLFSDAALNAPLIITGDHVPSVAEWLPNALMRIRGHRFLGPRGNGEAGALEAIDRLHGMSADDLVRVAREELAWRRALGSV